MKFSLKPCLTVVLPFLLLILTGCKPEYTIETVVDFADGKTVQAADKDLTATLLLDRFTTEFGEDAKVEPLPNGYRILTRHQDQPIAEMGKLIGLTQSAKLEIYDVARIDKSIIKVLDSLDLDSYPASFGGYQFGDAILAVSEEEAGRDRLLADVNASPMKSSNMLFVPGEMEVQGADGQPMTLYLIWSLRNPRNNRAPLDNSAIAEAKAEADPNIGRLMVTITMTEDAAKFWERMTTDAFNDNQRQVAILINGKVLTAPSVNSPITGGRTAISHHFTVEEAQSLARQISVKSLPVELEVVAQNVVD